MSQRSIKTISSPAINKQRVVSQSSPLVVMAVEMSTLILEIDRKLEVLEVVTTSREQFDSK